MGAQGGAALEVWEARAEYDMGRLMGRYLTDNPPPGRSEAVDDLREFAARLEAMGTGRLAELGLRRLRALGPIEEA